MSVPGPPEPGPPQLHKLLRAPDQWGTFNQNSGGVQLRQSNIMITLALVILNAVAHFDVHINQL